MKETIRKLFLNLGADVCGFASADCFADAPSGFGPCDIWSPCKTVIVFAVALPKGLLEVKPGLIYEHSCSVCCPAVDKIALFGARELEKRLGATCVPLPCDGPYDAWNAETLTGHGILSLKHAAVAAGLGTLGKNSLLLNRDFGNRLVPGAVLTDLAIPSDAPAEPLCIPDCRKCLDTCPVHALDGVSANQSLCRPHTYGTTPRGFDTVLCNECRAVCPMRNGVKPRQSVQPAQCKANSGR
jgi:epoxyqueuosine reductase